MALTATNCKHTLPLLCTEEYLQPRRPMLPHVSPAGERPTSRTAKPADTGTTASCLSFAERPQTPPHEKKYRQSALHEPGAIVRHFGTAEDALPEGTFGRATHAKPGESVADYIQSYPQSALKQWALQQAEDVYASSKLEPLGKGWVRGHKIPEGLGTVQPFGTAVYAKELDRAGQAKSAMFPADAPAGSSRDPNDPNHHMYVRSHGAYAAGEQRDRHYDWQTAGVDPTTHSFGKESGLHLQHGLKEALQPGQSPEACSATLCDQRWAQFQQSTCDELGQIKRLGMDGRQLPAGHVFGVPSKHEGLSVSALLKGDYTQEQLDADPDLGKSVKEGWRNLGPADRIYGVPSVRRDITAPKKQSIANDQNYGNEPNSRQLISPASSSERGLAPQQLQQQLSHEALRDIVQESGITMDAAVFDALFQHAALRDQSTNTCSLSTFLQSRQIWLAEQLNVDCSCLH